MASDIYFEREYGKLYEIEGKEKIENFYFESEFGKVKYIFLKRKIDTKLGMELFDITTPYGYGGPYFYEYKEENLEKLKEMFNEEFKNYCINNGIVSEFVRFHPLYDNYRYMTNLMELIPLSDTVYMQLENEEQIMADMDGKTRNMVRKAIKNGVTVGKDESLSSINKFIELYYETMDKNSASSSYYFNKDYFKELFDLGEKKVALFNAYYENKIISTTTILMGEEYIHYHLSANTDAGYKLAANNLLLFEVAKWGAENGYKKFHLGGGYGGNESPLFKFKKSMAKNNIVKFYIGKRIYNLEIYNILNKELEDNYPELKNDGNGYFPSYRRK